MSPADQWMAIRKDGPWVRWVCFGSHPSTGWIVDEFAEWRPEDCLEAGW